MILLKDGWNTYAEDHDGKTVAACIKGIFNDSYPPTLSVLEPEEGKRAGGARLIKENIKKDIGFILLKDGWKYNEYKKAKEGDFMVSNKDRFNCPQPPMFHTQPKGGGSRVIPENVKVDIGFNII